MYLDENIVQHLLGFSFVAQQGWEGIDWLRNQDFHRYILALGDSINLNVAAVETVNRFCNKVWNALKFTLAALGEEFTPLPPEEVSGFLGVEGGVEGVDIEDVWG